MLEFRQRLQVSVEREAEVMHLSTEFPERGRPVSFPSQIRDDDLHSRGALPLP